MNLGRSKGYPLCPQRLSLTRRVYQTVQRKRVVIGLLQNKILTNKKKQITVNQNEFCIVCEVSVKYIPNYQDNMRMC